jgi:hypothetical protein
MAVTIHKPQNTKDDTFLIRIANEDNETGWITLTSKRWKKPEKRARL